jgi:predicted nucleic acid-binding protein
VEAVVRGGGGSAFESWPSPPPASGNPDADVVGVLNDCREFALFLSPHVLEGLAMVLAEDYRWDEQRVRLYVRRLVEIARKSGGAVLEPACVVADCVDWEDNRVLELADDSGAIPIVSEDHHLTELSPWRGIPVMRPRQFAARVDAMRRARNRRP